MPACGVAGALVDQVDQVGVELDFKTDDPDALVACERRIVAALDGVLARDEDDVLGAVRKGILGEVEMVAKLELGSSMSWARIIAKKRPGAAMPAAESGLSFSA